jgi:hypothetical protein
MKNSLTVLLFVVCFALGGLVQNVFAQEFVEDEEKYGVGKVYTSPDFSAVFPGGKERINEYVKMKLEMQDVNLTNPALEGTIVANYVVDINGKVQKVYIFKGVSPEIDEEVTRALVSMPKWTPAKVGGEAVRSLQVYRLTISR